MRSNLVLMLLSAAFSWVFLLSSVGAYAAPDVRDLEKRSYATVDSYSSFEYPIALAGLYANIGSSGSKAAGADAGVVIASPSQSNPDYFYTWIRDSSLVYKYIIDRYVSGRDTTLLNSINTWISSMTKIQQISNPSGTVSTGGLGEPKFLVTEQAFTDGWGRPQRDGPALRSTAIITFANKLISQGNTTYVQNTLWPVLLLDLNFVANNWNNTGYDLWEEVNGASFFTSAVQHRALRQGIALATTLGDPSGTVSSWTTQANIIFCFLQSYWSSSNGYIVANVNPGNGAIRSGKDANTILTSIHTFDPSVGCDERTFQPCSDKALANLKVYADAFRSIYPINSGIASNAGVATGRYPEDSYYNGNPWYLTTFAVAEQLYRALQVWDSQGVGITVTSISLPFFQQFNSAQTVGTIAAGSTAYTSMTTAILTFADQFALIAAQYTPSTGSLSEQYLRADGTQTSASDLTWSYASVLTMFDARARVTAESWGAGSATFPSGCGWASGTTTTAPPVVSSTSSVTTASVSVTTVTSCGCVTSVSTITPSTTVATTTSTVATTTSTSSSATPTSTISTVIFKVTATTVYGENIYLTGSIAALATWSTSSALGPLSNTNTYPVWTITVTMPANTAFQYKYIRENNGAITWEDGSNRSATSPAGGATLTLTDTWK